MFDHVEFCRDVIKKGTNAAFAASIIQVKFLYGICFYVYVYYLYFCVDIMNVCKYILHKKAPHPLDPKSTVVVISGNE